ncbi:MAG: hypothetical protein GY745_03235 [Actinomycetia bacterium]|nr:hypothetical protein [Actinomycetes bacterium]
MGGDQRRELLDGAGQGRVNSATNGDPEAYNFFVLIVVHPPGVVLASAAVLPRVLMGWSTATLVAQPILLALVAGSAVSFSKPTDTWVVAMSEAGLLVAGRRSSRRSPPLELPSTSSITNSPWRTLP